MLDPILYRLLIGALVIFIFEAFLGILTMDAKAKQLLNIILIVIVIIYIVFGSFLLHS